MPGIDYFRTLYGYTCWARDRVLEAASRLPEADYIADLGMDHGSIHSTLVHTFAAEALWRQRWLGREDAKVMTPDVAPSLAVLRGLWSLEDAKVRAYLEGLSDSDMDREIAYVTSLHVRLVEPLWQHLTQIVVHGAQHRSEAAMELTRLGHSPEFLDFIAFTRVRSARA